MIEKARFLRLLPVAILVIACSPADDESVAVVPASHVFLDGTIYRGEAAPASALAVSGDHIVFVGDSRDARAYVGPDTQVHELAGQLMLPGLHDLHIHPLGIVEPDFCEFKNQPMSLEQIAGFVADCIQQYEIPAGEWVSIPLWNFASGNQPSAEFPTLRKALDAASAKHPVFIAGSDGHHGAANSLALSMAVDAQGNRVGINRQTLGTVFSDYRALVAVDANGEPSGGLTEAAMTLTGVPGTAISTPEPAAIVRKVPAILAAAGITTILDAVAEPHVLPYFAALEEEGAITFRYHAALALGFAAELGDRPGMESIEPAIEQFRALREQYARTRYIRAETAKVFVDGVLEGDPLSMPPTLPNAAMLDEYQQPIFVFDEAAGTVDVSGYVNLDSAVCQSVRAQFSQFAEPAAAARFMEENAFHPRQCERSQGVLEHSEAYIQAFFAALAKNDFSIHAHAIGDRAVRLAVDAIENATRAPGARKSPHHIAHAQIIHPDDQMRLGANGIYVAFTHAWSLPDYAYDMTVIPFIDQLENGGASLYDPGGYYLSNVYPANSIKRHGGTVLAGSDAPVDTRDPRPFFNIEQAVMRSDASNPNAPVYNASERLDIHDTIAAYTVNGARALNSEASTGSLTVGKKADLIVLDRNIVELATSGKAADISEARVLLTLFDGRIVHDSR